MADEDSANNNTLVDPEPDDADGKPTSKMSRYELGKRKAFAGLSVASWEMASHCSFVLGAVCYLINSSQWVYLETTFVEKRIVEDIPRVNLTTLVPGTNESMISLFQGYYDAGDYYNYYYVQYIEINGSASWFEIFGAIFYMLNPLLEFGTGLLGDMCNRECSSKQTFVDKLFNAVPWGALAGITFFIGSALYLINVFIARADESFSEAYKVVDLSAAIIFFVCCICYLMKRLYLQRKEAGTKDARTIVCRGTKCQSQRFVDWGFWGDMCFIVGCILEIFNHFHYTSTGYLIASLLWLIDAILYIVEWVLIHKVNLVRIAKATVLSGAKQHSGDKNLDCESLEEVS